MKTFCRMRRKGKYQIRACTTPFLTLPVASSQICIVFMSVKVHLATFVKKLIKGVFRKCMPSPKLSPEWELNTVLAALMKSAFEQFLKAPIRHLTWKTFLLAIISYRDF